MVKTNSKNASMVATLYYQREDRSLWLRTFSTGRRMGGLKTARTRRPALYPTDMPAGSIHHSSTTTVIVPYTGIGRNEELASSFSTICLGRERDIHTSTVPVRPAPMIPLKAASFRPTIHPTSLKLDASLFVVTVEIITYQIEIALSNSTRSEASMAADNSTAAIVSPRPSLLWFKAL